MSLLEGVALPPEEAPRTSTNVVRIPYIPRKHFIPLHESKKRFKLTVAHRRAGKSVSQLNELIKRALQNTRHNPPPRYAYVGPSFSQTKDLIWGYLKYYTSTLPGVEFSETDLKCILPNGASITLYGGAAAYERMRGLYFDGIVLDEFSMLNPSVFSTVVRPCLADYRGWAIVSGTSNGDDHFHELKKRADRESDIWDVFIIPVTETDALHPDEVAEMTKDMSPEEYAREMLCSFDAPVEGSYYGDLINRAEADRRITKVPHSTEGLVHTWWDLGMDDWMAIWIWQQAGQSLQFIDHIEFSGKGLEFYANLLKGQHEDVNRQAETAHRSVYNYGVHVFPPDIKVRELGTGKSRYEVALSLLGPSCFIAPSHRVEDGIQAVRSILPKSYWDADRCAGGVSAMRNYHKSKTGQPVHNWASHSADAKRIGAVALNQTLGYLGSSNVRAIGSSGRLKRRIRGIS